MRVIRFRDRGIDDTDEDMEDMDSEGLGWVGETRVPVPGVEGWVVFTRVPWQPAHPSQRPQ